MFSTFKNKGFSIKFDNNYVVSIQFGLMNYCDNYLNENSNEIGTWSKNAEVAIFLGVDDAETMYITESFCRYKGIAPEGVLIHQTSKQVLEILNWAEKQEGVE